MQLLLIFVVCLPAAVTAAGFHCMPEQYEGQVYDLTTGTIQSLYVDEYRNTAYVKSPNGDFVWLNTSTSTHYIQRGGNCSVIPANQPVIRCIPKDKELIKGNIGGFPVVTFRFQSVLGFPAFNTWAVGTYFPVMFGATNENFTRISNVQLYFNVKKGLSNPRIFDEVNLDACRT